MMRARLSVTSNHGNLLVSEQAIVALIDCDSFEISDQNSVYPCLVECHRTHRLSFRVRAFMASDGPCSMTHLVWPYWSSICFSSGVIRLLEFSERYGGHDH